MARKKKCDLASSSAGDKVVAAATDFSAATPADGAADTQSPDFACILKAQGVQVVFDRPVICDQICGELGGDGDSGPTSYI
jgi:hypothetical protein